MGRVENRHSPLLWLVAYRPSCNLWYSTQTAPVSRHFKNEPALEDSPLILFLHLFQKNFFSAFGSHIFTCYMPS